MPNRYIRDDARTSKPLASLTDFGERCFWRLLLVADDYGRFDADPEVALAACFPRRLDSVSRLMVELALAELATVGAIRVYEDAEGAAYGEFIGQFKRCFGKRAKHSKYPDPPASARTRTHMHTDAICTHMLTDAPEYRISKIEITKNDTQAVAVAESPPLPPHLAAVAKRVLDKLPYQPDGPEPPLRKK